MIGFTFYSFIEIVSFCPYNHHQTKFTNCTHKYIYSVGSIFGDHGSWEQTLQHSLGYTIAVGTAYSSELVLSMVNFDDCWTTGSLGLAWKSPLYHVTYVKLHVSSYMCHATYVMLQASWYMFHVLCVTSHPHMSGGGRHSEGIQGVRWT